MGYNKILVPLDGSPLAELALQHIPQLAAPGAEIHLVSAVIDTITPMMALGQEMCPPVLTDEVEARETYLNHVANRLARQGFKVTVEAHSGSPVELISCLSNSYDLIVMATHGRKGLSKFIMGSVSEAVLHEACCPVLIV